MRYVWDQLARGGKKEILFVVVAFSLLAIAAPRVRAQAAYQFSIFAGPDGGPGYVDGSASTAKFYYPNAVATDGNGNTYVADSQNHVIRKISSNGVVSTLAGSAGSAGFADGTGQLARFNSPSYLTFAPDGNLYVSDSMNHTIRRVTLTGVVTTFAGAGAIPGSSDGTGSAVRFNQPRGIAVDGSGILFVADYNNHTIRKISPAGEVSTWAGSAGQSGDTNGQGSWARFNYPLAVTVTSTGIVYVTESANHQIRQIQPDGIVSTLAKYAPNSWESGGGSGGGGVVIINPTIPTNLLTFTAPSGIAVDAEGSIYIANGMDFISVGTAQSNNGLYKITSTGEISQVAGSSYSGCVDGAGNAALFSAPAGLTFDGNGNLLVADAANHAIRKVTPSGVVTTMAGSPRYSGSTDGNGLTVRFGSISDTALDAAGNLYIADSNHTIRKITPDGTCTTLAGLADAPGSADGPGAEARFNSPTGLVVDATGNVYVADTNNHTVRKITPAGIVTTIAGSAGLSGMEDGPASAARFKQPSGIAVASDGTLFVTDGNNTIRQITSGGIVSTLAGDPTFFGFLNDGTGGNGTGSQAKFSLPHGLVLDPRTDTLYLIDHYNADFKSVIRKVTKEGVVTTVSLPLQIETETTNPTPYLENSLIQFMSSYTDLAMDRDGNLYIAYGAKNKVLMLTPEGVLTNVLDTAGNSAFLHMPITVSVSPDSSKLYTALFKENHIAVGTAVAGLPLIAWAPPIDVTTNSATVRASVNTGGLDATVLLEYGPTTAYGSSGYLVLFANSNFARLTENWCFSLQPGTTYHYRFHVTTSAGTTVSEDFTFTTRYSVRVKTLAGSAGAAGSLSGNGDAARFNQPTAVVVDNHGTAYIADSGNHVIRQMLPDGTVSLFAGNPGVSGSNDGAATDAKFNFPSDLAIDPGTGDLYVADSGNHTIRKISSGGVVSTVAGLPGTAGNADGLSSLARFSYPSAIAVDASHNLYVADTSNDQIRKITPAGQVSTIAKSPNILVADGSPLPVFVSGPRGVAVGVDGTVYFSNTNHNTLCAVGADGIIRVLAGYADTSGSNDGRGTRARFSVPGRVKIDQEGNLCVADPGSHLIRKVTPDGIVSTMAGIASTSGSLDGLGDEATFNSPGAVAQGVDGTLYVADTQNHTIRTIRRTPLVRIFCSGLEGGAAQIMMPLYYTFGSPFSTRADAGEAYTFVNWTENGAEVSTNQTYGFTVTGDRDLVANFTLKPFYKWWKQYVPSSQTWVYNPGVNTPEAIPFRDGVPNVMKYLCGITPTAAIGTTVMSAVDKASLPQTGVKDVGPKRYLTLQHRKNPQATDLITEVQVSTDLKTWVTVTPDSTQDVTIQVDLGNGTTAEFPVVEYQVDTLGAEQKFIRLNVTTP